MNADYMCPSCGMDVHNEEKSNWTTLNVYRFLIFPDDLLVITSADEKEFEAAIKEIDKEPENIESVLHRMGHIALVACNPKNIKEFQF